MKLRNLLILFLLTIPLFSCKKEESQKPSDAIIDKRIWHTSRYSCFPDIIYFKGMYYVGFRESSGHVATTFDGRGRFIVLSSPDCKTWTRAAYIEDKTYDIGAGRFAISPDGEYLMAYSNLTLPIPENGDFQGTYIYFFKQDTEGKLMLADRKKADIGQYSHYIFDLTVVKHDDWYWGVAYYIYDGDKNHPILIKSKDGVKFEPVHTFDLPGNEAYPCFIGEQLHVFFRYIFDNDRSFVTVADPPYDKWSTTTYDGLMMHSPQTILVDGKILISMRGYSQDDLTQLGSFRYGVPIYQYDPDSRKLTFVHDIFPNTDTDMGYCGWIVQDDALHIVYYAYWDIWYQRITLNKLKSML